MESIDVLVLGGGMAGAAAALAAVGAGARTLLVRRGPGATALARGAWYDAPPPELQSALARAGLGVVECSGRVPHPDGLLVACALAASAHAHAALTAGAEHALVCGIAGLPSFRPRALATLWSDELGLLDHALEPVLLTLDGTPRGGWAAASLAAALERDPQLIAAPLAHAARERGAARAIVPAVLGLDEHERVLDAVQHGAGVIVGEALGTAPSLPGWRLDRALLRALRTAGVHVIDGRVTGHVARERSVQLLTVDGVDGARALQPGAVVLATGKFLCGGITAETVFAEPALECDVVLERLGRVFDDPGAAFVLTDTVRTEPQPVLALGVRTGADARPTDSEGAVQLTNVFAAGSVRAGTETALLGLGAAAQDGWRAGTHAAALAAAG